MCHVVLKQGWLLSLICIIYDFVRALLHLSAYWTTIAQRTNLICSNLSTVLHILLIGNGTFLTETFVLIHVCIYVNKYLSFIEDAMMFWESGVTKYILLSWDMGSIPRGCDNDMICDILQTVI